VVESFILLSRSGHLPQAQVLKDTLKHKKFLFEEAKLAHRNWHRR